MKKVVRISRTILRLLKENGFRDTCHMMLNYVKIKIDRTLNKKTDFFETEIPKKELNYLIPKMGKRVFLIAAIPYYDIGGGQRCSQLAKTFNKMGYEVKYFYSNHSCDPMDPKISIPTSTHAYINEKAEDYVRKHARKDDLFIFEVPSPKFETLLDIAIEKGCKIIYENIDNWETSLGSGVFDKDVLAKLLKSADLLVGTAKPLVKQLETYLKNEGISKEGKKILYLPNAVDEELFCGARYCEKPVDLITGAQTFLYYGSLWGEWFSWELVVGLAKKHKDYAINLIGNADGIGDKIKECPENIHFLGLKKQKDLPDYLRYVDYALLPFERGEIGDYVSPLKIFEYISMYTRVLSTSLPDIKDYPNVYFGDTVDEWEKAIAQDYAVNVEQADTFVGQNTWFHRVTTMLQNLYGEPVSPLKDNLSIIVLNYNNKNVIFKCVNSLLRFQGVYGYEIIVVDNGSTDGSYEMLKERYSVNEILICRNDKNGCSSGRNLGVSKAQKEFVLFLDSDQWATNHYWLQPYEELMLAKEDFGCIGWAAGFFAPSGTSSHTVDEFPNRHMPPCMLGRSDIGYLGSGGMLMKKADFENIGGFDVFYDPTCYEDTDISLKMRHYGKEIYYCPYLGVIHLPHQTTNAGSEYHKELTRQKKEYFINKWKKTNPKLLEYKK